MSRCFLMPVAQDDLLRIRDYYLEEAGYRVARQMIVEFIEAFTHNLCRRSGVFEQVVLAF
jgi:plasmid stabilization system protein ParE